MSAQSASTQYTPCEFWLLFQSYLSNQLVEQWIAQVSKRFYRRLYTPVVVLWGFIFQRLQADHTCDGFVSYLTSGGAAEMGIGQAGRRMSENTAAYCNGRKRFPLSVAEAAMKHTGQAIGSELATIGEWLERKVSLLDGSTVRLVAEDDLITHYGRPKGQHGASHWPRLRTVVAFDFYSGAVTGMAEGPYVQSEQSLAIRVIRQAETPQVWVGDRLYGIYHLVQVVVGHHHDAIFRIQAGHCKRWVQGTLSSGTDLDVVWSPSKADQLEPDLPASPIAGRLIYVRVEMAGFRPKDIYLFTTLTDRDHYSAQAIANLYARRWHVELDLRHVKTTLQMEQLTAKSVAMVQKEWAIGLLAYNLIRGFMAQAAVHAGIDPLQLSFASTWRRICASAQRLRPTASAISVQRTINTLIARLSTCKLPKRSQPRYEPRAIRKKPQQFPYLVGSRAAARIAHLDKLKSKC